MLSQFFNFLEVFEDGLWTYVGVPLLMLTGIYLTYQSGFFQVRNLGRAIKKFFSLMKVRETDVRGVHPLKAFFASVGGCVGVGNIAGICTAVQIGGPGALFWIWVTAFAGMMIKYAEVYLGMKFRVPNNNGGYNGGPMYFLQHAFKSKTGLFMAKLSALLLCIYGVEIFQFSVVTESIATNFSLNSYVVAVVLLFLVLFAGSGGIRRVGNISSTLIPAFVIIYLGMGTWVLLHHLDAIPSVVGQVFSSAFSGTAAIGGFAGSTLMLSISQGVRRGCYTGDLGVGYASVIHSESSAKVPQEQALLAIVDIFLDTFIICTTSVLLILLTNVWNEPVSSGMMVQIALSNYFPYMHFFMPFFLFLLGYSTINAYFCVGLKCADFLSPTKGKTLYYLYSVFVLLIFSFIGTIQAQSVMTIANGLLLMLNCYAIFKLRHEISYEIPQEASAVQSPTPVTD